MRRLIFLAMVVDTPEGPRVEPRLLWALPVRRVPEVRVVVPPDYPPPAVIRRTGVHTRLPLREAWYKGGRELMEGGVVSDWVVSLQSS